MAKSNFKVIGLVGKGGSGKDACSKYLVKQYGAKEIVMSGYISKALDFFHIYPDRMAISWLIRVVRRRFGKGILVRAVASEIQSTNFPLYVLNGIRIKKEVELLRKKFGKIFVLVDIACDDTVRFERIQNRQKTGVKKDNVKIGLKEFLKWELRIGNEKEIPAIEKKADYVIDNNGTEKELYRKLDELITKTLRINS